MGGYLSVIILVLLGGLLLIRISRTRTVLSSIKTSEERIRKVIETAYDTFIAIDAAGNIIDWNRQAEATFGWPKGDVLGKSLTETIIPPQYREGHRRGLKHFLETGEGPVLNQRVELSALHRDGTEFPVEITIWPRKVDSTWHFNAFVRDIRKQKEAEEALKRKTEELIRSNRGLEEFAYVASHDLQEPLRKVLAFGERLKPRKDGSPLTEAESADYLGRMQNAAMRMQHLIDDLLAYSRVTTRAKPFEPANLEKIIQEVISDLEIRLEQSRGKIEVGPLPEVMADPTQMRQLFQNLLGNALKFSRKETGIGLAICHKIVQRHEGTLRAKSQPSQGSKFTIKFPWVHRGKGGNHGTGQQVGRGPIG